MHFLERKMVIPMAGKLGRSGRPALPVAHAVVKHPCNQLKAKAEQTLINIGAKFGLSPQSRASLAIDAVNAIEGVRRRNHYADADREWEDLIQ